MQYDVIITGDAENDIEQASDWYENIQFGLGTKFVLSIKKSLQLLLNNPFTFATVYLEIRKVNTKKFPYSIYYQVNENKNLITVFAVIHSSRNDKTWKIRI